MFARISHDDLPDLIASADVFAAAQEKPALPALKALWKDAHAKLRSEFDAGREVNSLLYMRAAMVDRFLHGIWQHFFHDDQDILLAAVGGYGRGELFPHSDIDILVLLREDDDEPYRDSISQFIMLLWDIGLTVGNSVRSLAECSTEAEADVTVTTNLSEARLLVGDYDLLETMLDNVNPSHLWPTREYTTAKLEEQRERHAKYGDSGYKLEPNVKEGPGGLRDIQTIGWVAKRHFGADDLQELVEHGVLTEYEFDTLIEAQRFMWTVRAALHMVLDRPEDRLAFDHQVTIARQLGYEDDPDGPRNQGVERFMQTYYRKVMLVSRLNELIIQYFEQHIVSTVEPEAIPIDDDFADCGGYLDARAEDTFTANPVNLLRVFLIMQRNPQLKGVNAATIRQIREARNLIDDDFRANPIAKEIFIDIFKQPRGLTHELRRMNRYGILARYIPAFRKIVGLMQFDLFHTYTVDEHILMVVRNLRRTSLPEFSHELPFVYEVIEHGIPKPELLYLAGLFHDIAKGRQGDHSTLGAVDALDFCRDHGLPEDDAQLVSWLVKSHLLMSMTAQRKDINDPDIIVEFAEKIGSVMRLNYLFALTVCDIRGTNPELWNSFRESLLVQLYRSTRRTLRQGLGTQTRAEGIEEIKRQRQVAALRWLQDDDIDVEAVKAHWELLDYDYFMRHTGAEMAWHARHIINATADDFPIVLVGNPAKRGDANVFIYMKNTYRIFAHMTAALDAMGLDVMDARIISRKDGHTMDTYTVLDDQKLTQERRLQIKTVVRQGLANLDNEPNPVTRRLSTRMRAFYTEPKVYIHPDPTEPDLTIVEVIAADTPGLLAVISAVFLEQDVLLHNARVTTMGERVEDLFFISTEEREQLSEDHAERLREALLVALNELPGAKPPS